MAFFFPTRRLQIRPWGEGDRPALETMTRDPEMMRFITGGRTWSAAQIDEFLERQARHIHNHGICFGAVSRNDNGIIIGLAGMQPLDTGDFELGWWIWKDYWGRGYAVEAVKPFIVHAHNMGLERLVAVIDPPNTASIRVAEKLGMAYERTMRAHETIATREDKPICLYAMAL